MLWSEWKPLEKVYIQRLPEKPGVYQVGCQAKCIVFIGRGIGRGGLKQRLGQRVNSPQRYLSAYEKSLRKQGCQLMFRYALADTKEEARKWRDKVMKEYKDYHGHLPPGNKLG